jgi:hypothetical protein
MIPPFEELMKETATDALILRLLSGHAPNREMTMGKIETQWTHALLDSFGFARCYLGTKQKTPTARRADPSTSLRMRAKQQVHEKCCRLSSTGKRGSFVASLQTNRNKPVDKDPTYDQKYSTEFLQVKRGKQKICLRLTRLPVLAREIGDPFF